MKKLPLLIIAFGLALLSGGILLTNLGLNRERAEIIRGAERNVANLAGAFGGQIYQTIRRLDQAVIHLRDEYESDENGFYQRVGEWQRSVYGDLAFQISIIGPDGLLLFSNMAKSKDRVDLSDREHFKVHKDGTHDFLFISKPVLGRVSGKWAVQFTRRLRSSGGSFAGVLVLSVDPAYLSQFQGAVDLGMSGVVALIGTDRVERAAASKGVSTDGLLGKILTDQSLFASDAPKDGVFRPDAPLQGISSIAAYNRINDYPLVVQVLIGEDEVLSAFAERRSRTITAGSVVALLVVASTLLIAQLVHLQARNRSRLEAAEGELAASEHRRHLALEAVGDGVWDWDTSTNQVAYSLRWKSMLGYRDHEISNSLDEWESRLHPEDREAVRTDLKRHLDGETPFYSNEHRVRCKDGSYKWILDRGVVVSRGADNEPLRVIGTYTDISSRKEAEQALEEKKNELDRYFTLNLDLMCIADIKGRFLRLNPEWEEVLGYSVHEFEGKYFLDYVHPDDMKNTLAALSKLASHEKVTSFENRYRHKDGSYRWIEWRSRPYGNLVYAVARDVTERHKIDQAKSDFISTVSHELRTPLTAIRGSLSLVNSGVLGDIPEEAKELTAVAEESAIRLIRLINDILDIEKIGSGQLKLTIAPLRLNDILDRTVLDNRAFADDFGVTLHPPEEAPDFMVSADSDRLLQVFTNLVSNAVKFSPQGGAVELTVAPLDGRWVRVSVIDHGPGIGEAFRARIFERFAQADASDSKSKGGTGLGLSISKGLVDRMGGRIAFDSEEGKGSAFHVDLPIATAATLADEPGAVMIVENYDAVAEILASLIEAEGYRTVRTTNADDAVILLQKRKSSIAAVILDLDLIADRGDEMLTLLRQQETERQAIPVVAISARTQREDDDSVGEAFAIADWLTPPCSDERLLAAVRRGMNSPQHRPLVLHLEDDLLTRSMVAKLLAADADVVGAATVAGALWLSRNEAFDLAILDIGLPDGNGLDVAEKLRNRDGRTPPIVVFSGRDSPSAPASNLVRATLIKSLVSDSEFVNTIRRLIAGPPNARRPTAEDSP